MDVRLARLLPLAALVKAVLPLSALAARSSGDRCSLAPPPPDNISLTITVDSTVTLFPPALSLASAGAPYVFANGDIQALVRYGANESRAIRSSDAGQTWAAVPQQPPPFAQRAASEVRTYAAQLQPDGEVVLFSGFNNASRDGINNGQDFTQRGPDQPARLRRSCCALKTPE